MATMSQMQRQAIRLAAAWQDFDTVDVVAGRAISHLNRLKRLSAGTHLPSRNATHNALQTACVICYARPFTANEGLGPLAGSLASYREQSFVDLHEALLVLRHKLVAHSDVAYRFVQVFRAPGSTAKHPAYGRGRFSLALTSVSLESEQFSLLRRMCKDRKTVLWPQLQICLSKLYPDEGEPYSPVLLNRELLVS